MNVRLRKRVRQLRPALWMLGALLLGSGCGSTPVRTYSDFPKPLVFIRQLGEYPLPDVPERYKTGPVAILWADGRVLQAVSEKEIGRRYVLGHVDPAEVQAVEKFVVESGLWFQEPGGRVVVHDPTRDVCVRKGDAVLAWMENYPENQEAVLSQLIGILQRLQPANPQPILWKETYPEGWCE